MKIKIKIKIQQRGVYCVGFNYRDVFSLLREIISKIHDLKYIYIYIFENFDNRLLVGVEFKFLKLR